MNEYIGYEYKELTADSGRASFLLDGYESFGWEADENWMGPQGLSGSGKVTLRLKRNRKIVNKTELTRLERNFEACVREIEMLERSKTSAATMCALLLALAGTAFMAGSTFAVTADPPHVAGCILLAIPGFAGWILPYFVYKIVLKRQTEKLIPLMEAKYDEIDSICEKGNKRLYC